MGIYSGAYYNKSLFIDESFINESGEILVDEDVYLNKRPGLQKITEMRQDPTSISIYAEDGKNFVSSLDLERYMEATGIFDAAEAVNNITEANNISLMNTSIVYDGCSDYIKESIHESGIIMEEAVEDNAMSVKQVQKWYNKMIKCSMSKTESIKEIDERIQMLEKCVSQMEGQMKNRSYDSAGRIKYALKDMIPLNWLYRVIKRQDAYAGLGWVTNVAGNMVAKATKLPGLNVLGLASIVVRAATYDKMLQANIDKTKNAIEKLKEMKEELKKSK
jgi:hypothetical protein